MAVVHTPRMYRPPARAPRGAWAQHLHRQRIARGLSGQQAFELVYERLGLSPKSRAVYSALDMGDRQPREEEATVLAAEFGWPLEDTSEPVGATETAAELVAALRAQARAIDSLVAELRAEREDGRDVASAFDRAASQLLAVLRPGGSAASVAQSSPHETAG